MLRKRVSLLLLLVLVMTIHEVRPNKRTSKSVFSELRLIIRTSMDLYHMVERFITTAHSRNRNRMPNELFNWLDDNSEPIGDIKLLHISSQLKWVMERMKGEFASMEKMSGDMRMTVEIDATKHDIASMIRRIKDLYHHALTYSDNTTQLNELEAERLKETLIGHRAGDLRDSLSKLYNYFLPGEHSKGSFLDVLNQQQANEEMCGEVQSASQYVYNMHKMIVLTEMMGQVAWMFGYHLQYKLENVNIKSELEQAQTEQLGRLKNYFRQFKRAMERTSLSVRPCDPPELRRDETFFEMEGLYQAVLVKDNTFNYSATSRGACETIDIHEYRNDNDGVVCTHLHTCWRLKTAKYCTETNGLRRYKWIEDHDGTIYGEKSPCQGQELVTQGLGTGLHRCENCICTCESGHPSRISQEVQAFSLRLSRSNTAENMVVTGIKFSRHKSIICIQIKQGVLLPGGEIDVTSEKWTDCDLSHASYLNARSDGSDVIDDDVVVLTSPANNVDLNDIVQQNDAIVTGIRFCISNCTGGHHVSLQLEYTHFNFSSGELINGDRSFSSPSCHTQRIRIEDTKSPLSERRPRMQNTIASNSSQYVRFGWSSFYGDVGQTTLPFLDAQPVGSKPSAPLLGVGLFYKASPGYGGFLAFKIHTLNYGKYMEDKIEDPPQDYLEDQQLHTGFGRSREEKQEKTIQRIHTVLSPYIALIFVPFCLIVFWWIKHTYFSHNIDYHRCSDSNI